MILGKDRDIKDFILSKNTYFKHGYVDVVKDVATGILRDGARIFPNDTLGNYFYIRNTKEYDVSYNNDIKLRSELVLVAVMSEGDCDILATNLIQTLNDLSCHMGGIVVLGKIITDAATVISNEIDDKKTAEAAMNRMGNTIISINFEYNYTFTKQCIKNPCTNC